MYYKYLNEPNISRSMQSAFGGINKNARIGSNEFADMQNMSGDAYPLMMPRGTRTIAEKQKIITEEVTNDNGETETVEIAKNLNGILGDVGFCAVWGTDLYYMGEKVDSISLSDTPKLMLAMGAHVIIYPDTVYYNTETGEHGQMETGESESGECLFSLYDSANFILEDGTTEGGKIAVEYTYYSHGKVDKEYSATKAPFNIKYQGVKDGYMDYPYHKPSVLPIRLNKMTIEYLAAATLKYRGGKQEKITVSVSDEVWKVLPVKSIIVKTAPEVTSTENLWYAGNHISIEGEKITLPKTGDFSSAFDTLGFTGTYIGAKYTWVHKNLPALDYVCVHENRLWGCRYGMQANGKTVNEIYCSRLGEFREWTLSSETATLAGDPYAMSVGEYGAFTGCVSLRGQLLFFKDNVVYRVSGNKPSNFQIDKISENGLQEGCEKSLETIDGVLFYKSRNGVFAYDGSVPQKISNALGNFYYTDAVAGKHFSKYYITMVHDGKRCLYVYDKSTGLWHAEDDADVRFFTEYGGALYGAVGNDIVCLSGAPAKIFDATESEGAVKWSAETGDIGLDSPYLKYYHRVLVRMDIDTGARVKVSIDTGESWMLAADFTSAKKQTVTLPVITPRCEHMRIRIDGEGMAKIYSIYYETETVEGN